MIVQLQMLGTGSAFAKTYWNNNGIITIGDTSYLIDCGITAPAALHHVHRSFDDFAGVIVTHIHADHVGGLEEYAFQMKFRYGRKPKLILASALVETLWEHTLKGGLTQEGIQSLEDVFEVIRVEPGTSYTLVDGINLQFIETPHIKGRRSYSLLFNDSFFYSGDIRFQPELLTRLVQQGAKHIWHDCQLTGPGEVHTTISELLMLPQAVQERISLMHYGDERPQYEGKTGVMPFINQHEVYTLSI